MALVRALPIPGEHHSPGARRRPSASRSPPSSSSLDAMGSVSSLIAARPGPSSYQERHCRPGGGGGGGGGDPGARLRRPTPGATCLGSDTAQDPLLRSLTPPSKRQPSASSAAGCKGLERDGGKGNYAYLNEDYVGDWNDNHVTPVSPDSYTEEVKEGLNGNMGGPPPRLVPVSGKLEKNMEKTVIRPTAFKPVIPKSRNSMQYLSPRHGASLSESQNNLNLLSPASGSSQREGSPSCSEKRNSYSGGRNGGGGGGGTSSSQSCSMSDSGRNSLSSLPPYGSTGYSLASGDTPHHEPVKTAAVNGHAHAHGQGHSNSDSGRSSSSKSTGSGSLSGRGQPLSDNGSSGRSPGPVEGYESVVRDLEDKLRERDLELQQLRENLDENEAAICQVYEEKQKRCELELEELRQGCATRMQTASQKAQRAQQVLQLQVFQLQQEKKKLQEDFSQLLQERERLEERCTSYEHEKIQLGPRLEETKWEVCQKSGEISLLKQQLKEVQGELAQRVGEIVSLRGQLRETRGELTTSQSQQQDANAAVRNRTMELEVCENELQRRKSEAELLREKLGRLEEESARLRDALANQSVQNPGPGHHVNNNRKCQAFPEGEEQLPAYEGDEGAAAQRHGNAGQADALQGLRMQMERMRAEFAFERQRAEEQVGSFEEERRVWQEEKEKVIHYQKQLQQNYVQMYRRNRELERVLRELSLELENREDMEEQDEGSGNEINFDEITATEI